MIFKKEFPSLKNKMLGMEEYGGLFDTKNSKDAWLLTIKDVRETCLDKQRVKEKLFNSIHKRHWPIIFDEDELYDDLCKELGL